MQILPAVDDFETRLTEQLLPFFESADGFTNRLLMRAAIKPQAIGQNPAFGTSISNRASGFATRTISRNALG